MCALLQALKSQDIIQLLENWTNQRDVRYMCIKLCCAAGHGGIFVCVMCVCGTCVCQGSTSNVSQSTVLPDLSGHLGTEPSSYEKLILHVKTTVFS